MNQTKCSPMVSVIIPTYNQTRELYWLLTSLEQQDYQKKFEVLVCDDGSSENTLSVIEKYKKKNASSLDIKYLWQPHQGFRVGHARNNGIRGARGDILIFTDGDCIVPPDWIAKHVKAHSTHKKIVGGTRAWVDVDLKHEKFKNLYNLYKVCRRKSTFLDLDRQKQLARSRLPWTACWSFNFSVPRHSEVYFDENMVGWGNEDYELFCRLYHQNNFKAVLKEDIQVYHIAPSTNSLTNHPWSGKSSKAIENYVQSFLYLSKKFHKLDLTEAMWALHYFQREKNGRWRKALPHERMSVQKALVLAEQSHHS